MMNMKKLLIFLLIAAIFVSCTNPYRASNKKYRQQARSFARAIRAAPTDSLFSDSLKIPRTWIGTTNFSMRRPNYVIIHHTAQNSCEQTLNTFTLERTQVSAHYLICKDGTLYHMLNDHLRAWHAGASKWGNDTDINSASIGIEIDNNGKDTFSAAQLNVLEGLLGVLKKRYNIPAANFIGHGDVAPSRKNDPNVTFPWQNLAEKGYGLWYGDTTNLMVPEAFDPILALRVIGYDVSNSPAAILAFRRHFLRSENTGDLMDYEKKVLYSLAQKFR